MENSHLPMTRLPNTCTWLHGPSVLPIRLFLWRIVAAESFPHIMPQPPRWTFRLMIIFMLAFLNHDINE